jgi:serine phosphatase RsbU (regulator of sigma subunit)
MPDGRPDRILVVDDEALLRRFVVGELERRGYDVTSAENGLRALKLSCEQVPDLIVCDLRMPVMDGIQLMRHVARDWPDVPVIVISGAGRLDDAVGALKLGAWDYLPKPFEMPVLELAITRALDRRLLITQNRRYKETLEAVNLDLSATLELLAADQDAGRQMQLRLLPKDHQVFGPFEFLRELCPSVYLSGDFIDAFAVDEGTLAFYLADVSGHGASSALVTVLLRALVRQSAHVASPARLLEHLNRQLLSERLDKHLTMFYGVLDLERGRLSYANAGHHPWSFLFDGQSCVTIEEPTLPLGLLPNPRYAEHALAFPAEGTFAVFSDGVLEMLPHPDLGSKMSYLRDLVSIPDVTIEDARFNLRLDAKRALPDDVAFLFIKRGSHDGYTGHGTGALGTS